MGIELSELILFKLKKPFKINFQSKLNVGGFPRRPTLDDLVFTVLISTIINCNGIPYYNENLICDVFYVQSMYG